MSSTDARVIRIAPRRAATVLSSRRSIALPDVLVTTMSSLTLNARVPKFRLIVAAYSAVRFMLVALTEPGWIASTAGATAPWRGMTVWATAESPGEAPTVAGRPPSGSGPERRERAARASPNEAARGRSRATAGRAARGRAQLSRMPESYDPLGPRSIARSIADAGR